MADSRKTKSRGDVRGLAQVRPSQAATRKEDPNVTATKIRETQRTIRVVVSSASKWGTMAFIFWTVKDIVVALAGRVTDANFKVELLSNAHFALLLAVVLTGGGYWKANKERKLRQRNTERDHARVAKLERKIDPGRTSATLTPSGEPVRKPDHE